MKYTLRNLNGSTPENGDWYVMLGEDPVAKLGRKSAGEALVDAANASQPTAGQFDRANLKNLTTSQRVRFLAALRALLIPAAPKNKVGTPIISDLDMIAATDEQMSQAYDEAAAGDPDCSARRTTP